jgi:PAS domain S-box-containing protein
MKKNAAPHFQDEILNSINEGVFTVDRNWRITAFNQAAERITGVDRKDALGCQCKDVFRASICENNCALKRTMESGKPVTNTMTRITRESGKQVAIRISTALLFDDAGSIVGGVETFQDLSQVEQLQKQLAQRYTYEDIIGRSPSMRSLFRILPQVAQSTSTVLIGGKSGTGKELFARAIHNLSPRKDRRFVAINCAALPDTLLESELFGYKAGAFTGAAKDKPGRFALAQGGTLFLDEIGDISPALQVRLLRVLQERTIEPLGGLEPIKVDVRIIAATNKDLARQVQLGEFRKDLFYRIRIVHFTLPELCERRVDIPLLVDHLVAKFNHLQNKDIAGVSEEVLARLMDYNYPGNVRELENILEHAFVLCRGGVIELNHLPPELRPDDTFEVDGSRNVLTLKDLEKHYISEALKRHAGNRTRTAKELGINMSTLYRKIAALQIETPPIDGRHRQK